MLRNHIHLPPRGLCWTFPPLQQLPLAAVSPLDILVPWEKLPGLIPSMCIPLMKLPWSLMLGINGELTDKQALLNEDLFSTFESTIIDVAANTKNLCQPHMRTLLILVIRPVINTELPFSCQQYKHINETRDLSVDGHSGEARKIWEGCWKIITHDIKLDKIH